MSSFVKVFSRSAAHLDDCPLDDTFYSLYSGFLFDFSLSLIQRPVFVGFCPCSCLFGCTLMYRKRTDPRHCALGDSRRNMYRWVVAINSDRFMTMGTESNAYDLAFAVILVLF